MNAEKKATLAIFNTKDSANTGATIDIPHPLTGEETGFKVTILGKDSDVYRGIEAQQRERSIRAANTTGTFRVTPEVIEQNAMELLVACTVKWEGLVDGDGNEVQFSAEAARGLYKTSPYVREVVDRNIADRSLFSGR